MPAITLFGYKSLVGGDDLQLPSALTIAGRIFQGIPLCGALLYLMASKDHCGFEVLVASSCKSGRGGGGQSHCWLLLFWILATLAFGIGSMFLESRILFWTNQGAPVQMEPRSSHVSALLEFKLWPGTILLTVISIMGIATLVTAVSYYDCFDFNNEWWLAVAGFLLLTQLAEVAIKVLFLYQLSHRKKLEPTMEPYDHALVQDMWAQRCASCCNMLSMATCYLFGGKHFQNASAANSFGDVAMALADFLESQDVLDIVLSDFMTGLLVLQRLQRQQVYTARQRIIENEGNPDDGIGMVVRKSHTTGSIDGPNGELRCRASSGRLTDLEDEEACRLGRSTSEDLLLEKNRDQSLYILEQPSATLSLSDLPLLDEVARYAKHALAIYSWFLYLYERPVSGTIRLALHGPRKFCSSFCSSSAGGKYSDTGSSTRRLVGDGPWSRGRRIVGDNILQTHKNAILSTAGIPEEDLVYVQLESSFDQNPYCIMLDHGWKTVVLSVRGTFSLEDCVTDTLISPISLEELGLECGFDAVDQYCHSGVVSCARNVFRDLSNHGILDQLLIGDGALYPDYTLRLVGHSLGASTSVLLSYMLRPKFPTLRCVAYSPPGCTFTWEMATRCNEWTTSCVLDSDIVPRLSVDSIRELRDQVLDIVGRIKVPKIAVARRLVQPRRCLRCAPCMSAAELDPEEQADLIRRELRDILYDLDSVPQYEYHRQVARFQEVQSERKSQRFGERLYPPGQILLISKTGEMASCAGDIAKCLTCCTSSYGACYCPVWVNNDALNEIVVSPTMGTDHFPTRIRTVLERVASEFNGSEKRS